MKCGKCGREISEEEKICPFCGESAEITVPVVSINNSNGDKKMIKYILIAVAVIIVAVVVTVIAVRAKSNKSEPVNETVAEESAGDISSDNSESVNPVSVDDDISVSFEGMSGEYAESMEEHNIETELTTAVKLDANTFAAAAQTAAAHAAAAKTTKPQITPTQYIEKTTVKSEEPTQSKNGAIKVISAFFNGKYYFDGTMVSGTEQTDLEIAMNGDDFQVFSSFEGTDIAIMNIDGKTYLMNPAEKKYMELTKTVMKMFGMEDDSFSFSFNNVKFDGSKPQSVTKAKYNGNDADCYTYKNSECRIDFIAVNDEIKQFTLYDSNGTAETVLQADEFSDVIPPEMLNFKGYSKANMISFFSSMM